MQQQYAGGAVVYNIRFTGFEYRGLLFIVCSNCSCSFVLRTVSSKSAMGRLATVLLSTKELTREQDDAALLETTECTDILFYTSWSFISTSYLPCRV